MTTLTSQRLLNLNLLRSTGVAQARRAKRIHEAIQREDYQRARELRAAYLGLEQALEVGIEQAGGTA